MIRNKLEEEFRGKIVERVYDLLEDAISDRENSETLHKGLRDANMTFTEWQETIGKNEMTWTGYKGISEMLDILCPKDNNYGNNPININWLREEVQGIIHDDTQWLFNKLKENYDTLNLPLKYIYDKEPLEEKLINEIGFEMERISDWKHNNYDVYKTPRATIDSHHWLLRNYLYGVDSYAMLLNAVKDIVDVEKVLNEAGIETCAYNRTSKEDCKYVQEYIQKRMKELDNMNIYEKVAIRIPEGYDLINVQRQSNHPSDEHLYLVEGFNTIKNEYAVWNFNIETGELYNDAYELTQALALSYLADRTEDVYTGFDSKEECNKFFEEKFGKLPLQSFDIETKGNKEPIDKNKDKGEEK